MRHKNYELSVAQARALMLATLGLLKQPSSIQTKDDLFTVIRRLHVLQLDTISVVNKSHYFVLWSRVGAYPLSWLDELLSERKLFEYWSHAACLLPIEDYPYYRALIDSGKQRQLKWALKWIKEHPQDVSYVMSHIVKHGAAFSSTFETSQKPKGGWWNWKTEKLALDALYTRGDLTITERKGFQRRYDLTTRGIPLTYRKKKVALEKVYEAFVEKTIQTLGIVRKQWIADYFRIPQKEALQGLKRLQNKKRVLEISVEGFAESLYVHTDNTVLVEDILSGNVVPTRTTLLSPFDPLVWDRKRVLELFGFDYRIESYTPFAKRKYGYFTLPILYKGELIGRIDAKAHRKTGIFEVKAVHFEKEYIPDSIALGEVVNALRLCASWHDTPNVVIKHVFPEQFLIDLRRQIL